MTETEAYRLATKFDPATEMATRYPDWIVQSGHIPFAAEVICWNLKVLYVDESVYGDLEWSLAHSLSHLDLGHGDTLDPDGSPFTPQQEMDADWLAKLRLDMDLHQINEPIQEQRGPRPGPLDDDGSQRPEGQERPVG